MPALLGLLALALIALAATVTSGEDVAHRAPTPRSYTGSRLPAQSGVLGLPITARAAVSRALGAADPAYSIERAGRGALLASGPAHTLRGVFTARGISVTAGTTHVSMTLRAVGFGATLMALGAVGPSAHGSRVTYSRAHLSEWYANGPLGLEQGFTLDRAPAVHARGPLTLSLAVASNATPSLGGSAQTLTLLKPGEPTLRYGGLTAVDARGTLLRSRMAIDRGDLRLLIDARGARYPIRVDPFFEQGEALTNGAEAGRFGESIAISEHGDLVLVGAPGVAESVGAAYVFKRGGGGGEAWSLQATLTAGGEVGKALFGHSVALSADGSTALVGGALDNSSQGAAWVFTRSGETWSQQGEKLIGAGEAGEGEFGHSVALSADGSTAFVGGPADNARQGAAWVFTRSGETWSQQGEKLIGAGEAGKGEFGGSVALSGEGNEALVGAKRDTPTELEAHGAGAAWVFTRSGTTWTQLGSKLTNPGAPSPSAEFATHVALSADGATALFSDASRLSGPVWPFARSGESFHSQGALEGASGESYGESVALSGDGNTALVGARTAWVFTRSGETWTRQGHVRAGTGAQFGLTAALASDDSLAVIGTPEADAAGVFVNLPEGMLPEVSGVTPHGGPESGGTTVTITGSHFSGAVAVRFGAAEATSFTVNSESSITAVSPPGALGTVDVGVGTAVGTSLPEPADKFSYGPSVSAVSPEGGPTAGGTTVTITGFDFSGASSVAFGGAPAASFTVNSDNSITAVSPQGTGAVDVTVTSSEGTSPTSSADSFFFTPPPTVEKVTPKTGPVTGGTRVEVAGLNLGGRGLEVKFGTVAASGFVFASPRLVGSTPPAPAGLVNLTVTTLGGTSTLAKAFKFLPVISSLSPNAGPAAGGTSVTVKGAGFAPGTSGTVFKFGTSKGTGVNCVSSTECTVISPAHAAGTVEVHAIVNKAASAKSAGDRFTYS